MSDDRPCGACTLCCELPAIEELGKPENVLCPNATAGCGCAIYASRPSTCREFDCFWKLYPAFDEGWKPDRCHLYVTQFDKRTLGICVDPAHPDAWRAFPFYDQIKLWARQAEARPGSRVFVHVGDQLWVIFPDDDLCAGRKTDGKISAGYRRDGAYRRPYVTLQWADGRSETVLGKPVFAGFGPVRP